MKRAVLTLALCLSAQTGWAYEGDRPEPRPALCRAEAGGALVPCDRLWTAAYTRPAPVEKPVKARKIIRLPWTIGAFQ